MPTNSTRRSTSFRLSEQTRALIEALSERRNVSQASIVEFAIAKLAEAEGVTVVTEAEKSVG